MELAESERSLVSCEAGSDGQSIAIGGFATGLSGSLRKPIRSFVCWIKSGWGDV